MIRAIEGIIAVVGMVAIESLVFVLVVGFDTLKLVTSFERYGCGVFDRITIDAVDFPGVTYFLSVDNIAAALNNPRFIAAGFVGGVGERRLMVVEYEGSADVGRISRISIDSTGLFFPKNFAICSALVFVLILYFAIASSGVIPFGFAFICPGA